MIERGNQMDFLPDGAGLFGMAGGALGALTTLALAMMGHKRRMYSMLNEESRALFQQMTDEMRGLRDEARILRERDNRRAEEMDALRRQHKQDMIDLGAQLRAECAAEMDALRRVLSERH